MRSRSAMRQIGGCSRPPSLGRSCDRNWASYIGGTPIGITCDPVNNSLWIAQWSGTTFITDYTLSGTPLFSFDAGTQLAVALAFDPADQSLWFFDRATLGGTETVDHFSTG